MSNLLVILYIAGFLRTLLIIVVVYYVIKLIAKLALPSLINKAQEKASQQFYKEDNRNEGEVTVETKRNKKSKSNKDDGEYVDFEEVE